MFSSFLVALIACNTTAPTPDVIALDWQEGQSFHLASSQREIANMTEESTVSLENYNAEEALVESWSDEVIWTYRVVESDFYPTADDELAEYSFSGTGDQVPLTVIKITIDETLNYDEAILALDPVVYLVFQSDRNRLAGIVQFLTIDEERTQEAFSIDTVNASWSILSQSNLAIAPTYLAPFGARWSGGERALENGSYVYAEAVEEGTTDVIFSDEMGGELVSARYEEGQPWPTVTMSENLTARLLSAEDIQELRASLPDMRPNSGEEFDYRAALRESINLDRSTQLSEELVAEGEMYVMAEEGYRPWAGAWWPLKKGELIFGYEDDRHSLSDLVREDIDPIKEEMDTLSEEIRELNKKESTDEIEEQIEEKRELFTTKQKELVDILVEFYNQFRDDLDGGKITVSDGTISKPAVIENEGEENEEVFEEAWTYELNTLSPMDKFALVEYLDGNASTNPFFLPAWEILNSYNPGGQSWWGHCNGWAAASILTNEPRETRTISVGGQDIDFTTADIKGLLTESHYSTRSHFYGERYNGEDDDITDLSPAHFHKLITFYLRDKGVPFVFDTDSSEPVWNFPVWKTEMAIEEADMSVEENKTNVNLATIEELAALEQIDEELAKAIVGYREKNGTIQTLEELKEIDGYTPNRHDDLLRTTIIEQTYDVVVEIYLTSDSVDNDHVDSDINAPESFSEIWRYTLTVNEKGTITGGVWENEEDHPDFAWVPYTNPKRSSDSGSENPYLNYGRLLSHFGDDIERK